MSDEHKFTDDTEAIEFLEARGFRIDRYFGIHKPNITHEVTDEEGAAIDHLCYEWDYGFHPSNEDGPTVRAVVTYAPPPPSEDLIPGDAPEDTAEREEL